ERAELRLAPGLNVLTGETGAGKTVLAHALDLLLGGRARPGIVRPGASEAYVEGVFALPARLRGELGERLPADAEEVVLARGASASSICCATSSRRSTGSRPTRTRSARRWRRGTGCGTSRRCAVDLWARARPWRRSRARAAPGRCWPRRRGRWMVSRASTRH